MAFPTSIPSYLGFIGTNTLAANQHSTQHNQEQADIIALATKLGTGNSTPSANKVFRALSSGVSAWSQLDLTTDVMGVLPVANGGVGQSSLSGLTLPSAILTGQPTISDLTSAQHSHSNAAGGGTLNGANAIQSESITPAQIVNRTRRIPLQLIADGTGGVTFFADSGYVIQFTTTPTAFGRGNCIIPNDYAGGSVTLRMWAECSATNSFAWQYYIQSHALGDNILTNGWNIANASVSSPVTAYTNGIFTELAITINSGIVAGQTLACAFKPNTNPTGTTNIRAIILEYTADS